MDTKFKIGDLLEWKRISATNKNRYVIVVDSNDKEDYFMTLPIVHLDDMDQRSSWSLATLIEYFNKVS